MRNNTMKKLLVAGVVMTGLVAGSAFAGQVTHQINITNNASSYMNYLSASISNSSGSFKNLTYDQAVVFQIPDQNSILYVKDSSSLKAVVHKCVFNTAYLDTVNNQYTLEVENQNDSGGFRMLQTNNNNVQVPVSCN